MRGAAAAKSAFDDPTKGGAVPQGRETAPSVVFSQCKDEKFHPSSRPSGYKRWFRRLRASFRPGALKDEISEHTLQGVDILVLGAPRAKFSVDEFDALKDFIRAGGSLLVLMDEGGEEALGTNVNYLLEEYGISVNADAAVRALPGGAAYAHPKETLVTDGVLNRAVRRFVERARAARRRARERGARRGWDVGSRRRRGRVAGRSARRAAVPDRRSRAIRGAVLRDAERAEAGGARAEHGQDGGADAAADGGAVGGQAEQGRGAGEGVRVGIGAYGER